MPNSKFKVPDGWDSTSRIGQNLPGTPIVSFKVPLKAGFNRSWGIPELKKACPSLTMVIDLTATDRYYSHEDMEFEGIHHVKMSAGGGGQVPSDQLVANFCRAVEEFEQQRASESHLLGLHCTHGLNRSGYLICCYLHDSLGLDMEEAIALTDSCRGETQQRQSYLAALRSRS